MFLLFKFVFNLELAEGFSFDPLGDFDFFNKLKKTTILCNILEIINTSFFWTKSDIYLSYYPHSTINTHLVLLLPIMRLYIFPLLVSLWVVLKVEYWRGWEGSICTEFMIAIGSHHFATTEQIHPYLSSTLKWSIKLWIGQRSWNQLHIFLVVSIGAISHCKCLEWRYFFFVIKLSDEVS